MKKLRVFIADAHAVVREGVKILTSAQPDMEVIGEASNADEAWRLCKELKPDIIIIDLALPGVRGAQFAEHLRLDNPQAKLLALSLYQDEAHIQQLITFGATSYVLKRAIVDELITAIRTVANGGVHFEAGNAGQMAVSLAPSPWQDSEETLSNREQEVLHLLAWDHSAEEIANLLQLSVKTVENHKARLMKKLDFTSHSDIARYALQRGWLKKDS